jgi:DNA polymerase I
MTEPGIGHNQPPDDFKNIVVVDFEYEINDGDLPVVLCMVAYILDSNLEHIDTKRFWRGEFESTPPFDCGPDTLFVAYSAWAEMTCFLTLGWKFPEHIFDQHTCYLAASNLLLPYDPDEERERPGKGLADAVKAYGIPNCWVGMDKKKIAKDIGEGRWREHGREACLAYCEEDVRVETLLLKVQLRQHGHLSSADVPRLLHWSNYAVKSIALIQARGMPIDMDLWTLVQENRLRVIEYLLREFDPSHYGEYPIYDVEGHFSHSRFERWLASVGIAVWPRLKTGALDTSGDAFRIMYHIPGIEALHALKDSLGVIARARIPIGRDGRNRPSLFPFGTATGRNAHGKSLFNAHAGMRSFMVFPEGTIGVYLDWRSQEVGVAAAFSRDPQLIEDYLSGDVYHALALMCGLTEDPDPVRWKAQNRAMRDRMKPLQLGINYGMGVPSLARGLDCHPLIAAGIIRKHQERCPAFWRFRENAAEQAMFARRIKSRLSGWPLQISTSPNQRTLYNFPMQSGGAEMIRDAAWRMCESGIVPSMLVHDGILVEARNDEDIVQTIEIMKASGRLVCDGLEIGVDIDQKLIGGERYRDKRPMAQKMWASIIRALQEIGALPWGPVP